MRYLRHLTALAVAITGYVLTSTGPAYANTAPSGVHGAYDCRAECPPGSTNCDNTLYNEIWGPCPKEPYTSIANQCTSWFDYWKCSIIPCATNPDGSLSYASPIPGSGVAENRSSYVGGEAQAAYGAQTIPLSDVEGLEYGGPESPNKRRVAGYPKLVEKGEDICKWYVEAAYHAANTARSYFANPDDAGTPQVYGGTPEVMGVKVDMLAPNPREYDDHYTGQKNSEQAPKVAEGLVQDSTCSECNDRLGTNFLYTDRTKTPVKMSDHNVYKEGDNPYWDRSVANGAPILSASTQLFLETPSYATYDPTDYRPGQELKMAEELRSKTPEEVAALKANPPSWLSATNAYAQGAGADIHGIFCRIAGEEVCKASSHYDNPSKVPPGTHEEHFYTRFPHINSVGTPQIQFMPDMAQKLQGMLGGILNQIAGQAIGSFLEKLSGTAANDSTATAPPPLSQNAYVRCLNAMRTPTQNTPAGLRNKEANIRSSCVTELLSWFQGNGGYSEAALNSYFNASTNNQQSSNNPFNSLQQGMSDVANFIFGGNTGGNIQGLTPFNLDNLGGTADLGQLGQILNMKLPNMEGLGSLQPHNGRMFGSDNNKQLPKTLVDLKTPRVPYARTVDGGHPFDQRSNLATFPERDMYSQCTCQKTCFVSKTEAPLSFWSPYCGADGAAPPPSSSAPSTGPRFWDLYRNTISSAKKAEILEEICGGDGFGPCPNNGLPVTNRATGPILFDEDGTARYAFKPEEKLKFVQKRVYTKKDAEEGILPKSFAKNLPDNELEPWDKLAAIIGEHGDIEFIDPSKLDTMVAEINDGLGENKGGGAITKELVLAGLKDYVEEVKNPTIKEIEKDASTKTLFEKLGIADAVAQVGADTGTFNGKGAFACRNQVYCQGEKTYNQYRTDVLDHRYKRFNGHVLQRIVYNRWCKADGDDPWRCRPGHVCAPKPCDPYTSCWSQTCWSEPCSPAPHIGSGPSCDMPVAATRYNYGAENNDIAYAKPINDVCGKVTTPKYESFQGGCNYYAMGCMTRAYNCRAYSGGGYYCGYSWAYHPDVKFVLDGIFKNQANGDFNWDVGERHMEDECDFLAEPVAIGNNHAYVDARKVDKEGAMLAQNSCAMQFFGKSGPCIERDDTRNCHGSAPGQKPNYASDDAYYLCTAPMGIPENLGDLALASNVTQTIEHLMSKDPAPGSGLGIIRDAYAATARTNQGSVQYCQQGTRGERGGSCPKTTGNPAVDSMETLLRQALNYRDFGLKIMVKAGKLMYLRPESTVAELLGTTVDAPIKNPTTGAITTATFSIPLAGRGLVNNPSCPFPTCGGGASPEESTGLDTIMEKGAEAGGLAFVLENGGGGTGEYKGPMSIYVARSVNQSTKCIYATGSNQGYMPDITGMNTGAGRSVTRMLCKDGIPGNEKTKYSKLNYPMDEPPCSFPGEAARSCKMMGDSWSTAKVYDFNKDDNSGRNVGDSGQLQFTDSSIHQEGAVQ